ncbi:hypothetical protein OF820_07800 [Oceanotoga sp. DSM 15011]|uniref:hypothetical protein n=1 Tax=unclassified Oceanotoga TaxID=2618448 RepID=UPI0021F3EFBB|nr:MULTISPECIES: hypothetical protein [unclassified Oceanotoga]MDN5342013.1 hypothetical protein [Oceanotoga sp.]UYO98977.1 hypothetical protein OF820_07800 [Oceanotoga sp. DSM 15011]
MNSGIDFWVYAVRYENPVTKKIISELKTSMDFGSIPYVEDILSKGEVLRKLKKGEKFCVVYNKAGNWVKGSEIKNLNDHFLRIDDEEIEEDFLGPINQF